MQTEKNLISLWFHLKDVSTEKLMAMDAESLFSIMRDLQDLEIKLAKTRRRIVKIVRP